MRLASVAPTKWRHLDTSRHHRVCAVPNRMLPFVQKYGNDSPLNIGDFLDLDLLKNKTKKTKTTLIQQVRLFDYDVIQIFVVGPTFTNNLWNWYFELKSIRILHFAQSIFGGTYNIPEQKESRISAMHVSLSYRSILRQSSCAER